LLTVTSIKAVKCIYLGTEKIEEQRLEAAQMKFLRNLLGITKLDKEKNQCIRKKQEHRP